GKYQLDVSELRQAFLLSDTLAERIRRFRAERLMMIGSGDTPIPIEAGACVVLHLVPLWNFGEIGNYDLRPLSQYMDTIPPIYKSYVGGLPNFDGFLVRASTKLTGPTNAYVQVFRDGGIESVDVYTDAYAAQKTLGNFDLNILTALRRYLAFQE